ncbi:hypothetical protein PGB90_000656 [Kerria lacca]
MSFFKGLLNGEKKTPQVNFKSESFQVAESTMNDDENEQMMEEEAAGDEITETEPTETEEEMKPTEMAMPDDAITTAPSTIESQFTTTSMVMTSEPTHSMKKHRRMSKIEAVNEFLYGHSEEPWIKPGIMRSIDVPVSFRANRAHTMRHSIMMKRKKDEEETRSQVTAKMTERDVPSSDDESMSPLVARKVPKYVYGNPKIVVRETKSSKFRYLFNRKPPGVKVVFRPANEDSKKKPPFVVAAINH